MKKILYSIIASICMFGTTACSDMLDSDSSRQVSEPELNAKADSIFFAYGIMQAMQQLSDQYFFQNEMRGELVSPANEATTHLKNLASFTAGAENQYDSVYLYYKVINNCNYYLAKRDTTLASGTRKVTINEFVNVAAFRAWAYLQMTSQYGDVPYVTQPLTTISEINAVTQKTNYKSILASQAEYMQALKDKYAAEYLEAPIYNNADIDMGFTNTGSQKKYLAKKCFVPFNVVLGDLYLEIGEYAKAAKCYYDFLEYKCDYLSSENQKIADESKRPALSSAITNAFNNRLYDRRNNYDITKQEGYNIDTGNKELKNGISKWDDIFTSSVHSEILSYIPIPVNYTLGYTCGMPLAFGYDYYATSKQTRAMYSPLTTPEAEKIPLRPSEDYAELAYKNPYYYVSTELKEKKYTDENGINKTITWNDIKSIDKGDGRANMISPTMGNTDLSMVYTVKPGTGYMYLYRISTVYMHLAEALNRMGEPELAFAMLKRGLGNGEIKELVDTAAYVYSGGVPKVDGEGNKIRRDPSVPVTNYFIPVETFHKMQTGEGGMPPFYSDKSIKNYTNTAEKEIVGMHFHGAGAIEDIRSPYNYYDIVRERINKIRQTFGVGSGVFTKEECINAVEDLLCDEYALEFAFEGRRFSDLLRIARHKNEAGTYTGGFGDMWLSKKLEKKAAGITTQNCYLPFK
ncbi:MAG: RagB/SusD family nutrient uptake outer membrane protein [Prevotella sp.]|nr:RagB/SusD family nutrient uptake outer membrane protein [Candidatus Prevotella equi]